MSASPEAAVVVRETADRHPAARAWRQLRRSGTPSEVRILKEPSKGIKKSAVYLLAEAGPGGGAVIAKRARRSTVEVEALVYGDLLVRLDVGAPRFYGAVDEAGPFCWLFIEHAAGEAYSPADPRHRRLAGRWLGRLHGAGMSLAAADRLPGRGMGHHLGALKAVQASAAAHRDDPSLAGADASMLVRLTALIGELRDAWPRLEGICAELPPTLVHGDMVRKNLRIGAGGGGPRLIVLDWENAGWGTAAPDLAQSTRSERFAANPCLDAYRSALRLKATLPRETIERQVAVGTVLRFLAAIQWTCLSLGPPWRAGGEARAEFVAKRPKTMPQLEAYLAGLRRSWAALAARGWI